MATSGKEILTDRTSGAPTEKRTNYRWMLAGFAMLLTFMSYMDRVNLSVSAPAIIKEFHFTMVQIGLLQTVFFVCYALFQIPSGVITEYFGHRRVVTFAVVWWSAFTSLTAFCGRFSTWIVVRGLFAVGESPLYPALNHAFSMWFPKKERGKAPGFLVTGSCLGQIIGMPLSLMIMVTWGWRAVFLFFGAIGVVMALGYFVLLRTHPRECKFLNAGELEYIADGGAIVPETRKAMAPWKDFLRSSQFWAVACQFCTTSYINYLFISWLPVYLLHAHGFSLKQMGLAAMFVFAGPAIGGMVCGIAADYVIGKRLATAKCRAWFGGMGLLLCCGGLYMTATNVNPWSTVAWLSFALFCMGCSYNASWSSCIEMGGRFTGTVTGWMNLWGHLFGATSPPLTAWVATRYSWQAALFIAAAMGVVGAISWIFVKPHVVLKNAA